jgi:histidinol phosphatase-like PHP family hydrolase
MSIENLSWFEGPFTHVHVRYPGERNEDSSWEVLQFDYDSALRYMQLLSGKTDIRITDTNHAIRPFDEIDLLNKPMSIDKDAWQEQIRKRASEEMEKRIAKIRSLSNPKIIVGVEVDIVDEQGELSLSDECLEKSDFTIASFHRFIWSIFSQEEHFTSEELIRFFEGALDNPHVFVLGHPTMPSSKMLGVLEPRDYSSVVEKMTEKGIAYEVPILCDLLGEQGKLTREVIGICGELGTPLVLSTDFHHLKDLDFLANVDIDNTPTEVAESDVETLFEFNRDVHYRIVRRLIRNIDALQSLGIKKDQVINSSDQRFDDWLNARKSLFSQ